MSVVVADASPSDDPGQIVARPQWQHSNLALFLEWTKDREKQKEKDVRATGQHDYSQHTLTSM